MTRSGAQFSFLLFALFAFMVTPIWDADSWWHLASGRWILEQLSIPSVDPFGIYPATDQVRNDTVLQGQWLGQVLLYICTLPAGLDGLIVLRALLLSAGLVLVWLRTPVFARGTATLLLIPAGMITLGLTAERPQLFAYVLAALCFLVLERRVGGRWCWLLILLLTVLWANIHGSVLLWVALLLLGSGFVVLRDLSRYRSLRPASKSLLLPAMVSVPGSLMTPNTWATWWYLLDLQGSTLQQATSEYISSLLLFRLGYWLPQLWVIVLMLAALVALRRLLGRRSLQGIWLLFLLLISMISYRYLAFFLFIGLPWVARALPWRPRWPGRFRLSPVLLPVLCLGAVLVGTLTGQAFATGERGFPGQALRWMQQQELGGKVFTSMRWGGYLLWYGRGRLQPWIDGRLLDQGLYPPYTHMLWATPEGQQRFVREQFDYVLLPRRNRFGGEEYRLHAWLQTQGWRRLYIGKAGEVLWAPALSGDTDHR